MKRVGILVAAIVFTISINTQVFAIGVENSNSTSNEININEIANKETKIIADSIFYFINKGLDNLKLFLNLEDVKKTEIILQIENERLARCDDMTDKEKYELAKDMIKELEKGNKLSATRQEYQLVKVSLEQAKKSGDEVAIKVAEELLKEKQSLYKVAIEEDKSVNLTNKVEGKTVSVPNKVE
ncbi:DUF5667 domain-containing protein [Clostridium estertheticum]|uniref:DUF5667 domain-containing protein n=1 Tax=Clostridium estertheticum TaxID=238834 RepID=A0AA47EFQ1_9CLOT|nr:DUF5667 domain-containing protein [Clostridium estertheticum]MBU3156155.1 hypothetical protein [Clostridium estertheticum]MBU3199386.1 hypothetical protein [Clostridium estertheticum]WAG58594.1 DUF5667 domain-containing protein [Clostridium estertheticum]WAG67370.1 DUF5667 domain-containing protein [Clostridium estertheticum]